MLKNIPRKKLNQILIGIRDRINSGGEARKCSAICGLVHFEAFESEDCYNIDSVLKSLFVKWPKYSGDRFFPVPSSYQRTAQSAFWDAADKWTGEYGALRMELLKFMIRETR
jgi:hypothetical protein